MTFHPTVLKVRSCQLSAYIFNTLGKRSTTSPLQDFSLVAQLISFRVLLWHSFPKSPDLTFLGLHNLQVPVYNPVHWRSLGREIRSPKPNPTSTGLSQGTAYKQRQYNYFSTGFIVTDDEQTHTYLLFIADFCPPNRSERLSTPCLLGEVVRHVGSRLRVPSGP